MPLRRGCQFFRQVADGEVDEAAQAIVRARQFFEFVSAIAESATGGQTVRLPATLLQPIGSDDVAGVMTDVVLAEPLNGTVDLAGPEPIRLDELVRRFLSAHRDARTVITDVRARYFGTALNDQSLTPGDHPRLGPTRFEGWLSRSLCQKQIREAASAAPR